MNGQWSVVPMRAASLVFAAALSFVGLAVNSADAQSGRAINNSGGEVTIIKGPQENALQVRSARFRCRSCIARVVDALKKEPGISDVTTDDSAKPLILRVHFDPSRVAVTRIGILVKKALESDPYNTAPAEVKYASEK